MANGESFEIELKLQTEDPDLLDRLWARQEIGPFRVTGRRIERQSNAYFDSPDHALDRAQGNLRWRTFADSPQAELTYKGPSEVVDGVFRRLEITARLPANLDPLSIQPPPEPLVIARRLSDRLERTDLVLENERRSLELKGLGARVELDLDTTTMPGTEYQDLEIEAELLSGDVAVLQTVEASVAKLGLVQRATRGKRARGWGYLETRRAP